MTTSWASGDSYDFLMGRWSRLLAPKSIEWARIPSSTEVLDVGCGTGALTEAILAAGAKHVTGVDPSPDFIAHVACKLGQTNAEFHVGDAMDLRLPDESFDAVVSGLVLNFIPDPTRALQEMYRVAKPRGIVSVYVWDYAKGMQMLRYYWDAAVALDPAARSLDEGLRFALCQPKRLKELFQSSGLVSVEVGSVEVEMNFRDFDDYWRPFLGGQGPSGGYAISLSEEKRVLLREDLRARLPRGPAGQIKLISRAWAVRGIKPNG